LPGESSFNPWWSGPLIYLIGVPVMALTLAILSYVNFKTIPGTPGLIRKNLVTLALALLFVVATTTAVYQRSWELVQISEPGHGPAQLSLSERPILRGAHFGKAIVQHSDGRIWVNWIPPAPPGWKHREEGYWLEGSNWVTAVATELQVAGLRQDGTLWVSDRSWVWYGRPEQADDKTSIVPMLRIGDDRDWKGIASTPFSLILLKTDGSLWRLGPEMNAQAIRRRAPLHQEMPVRLEGGSDWAGIGSMAGFQMYLRNQAGEIYVYPNWSATETKSISIDAGMGFSRIPAGVPAPIGSPFLHGGGMVQTQIGDDGRFRIVGRWIWQGGWRFEQADLPVGDGADWVEAAVFDLSRAVTLKSDGTLWLWELGPDPVRYPEFIVSRQLSRHSDWVAVTFLGGSAFIALAADGTLWKWEFPSLHVRRHGALTRPPRHPQKVSTMLSP
jgi:hypothetical protein